MSNFAELQSSKAIVCRREVNGDQGGATVWMVCLADGFLLDCGSSRHAKERATLLATIVNEAGPERLRMGKA